jgi:PPOX class probable F420-dependent enzyme
MELASALAFAAEKHRGVLVTIKSDGRPQLSNIAYRLDGDTFDVSITADRAKYANLRRDPRASIYVTQDDFWAYVVYEGDAALTPVAADPHDATVDLLVETYRAMAGEHPDWDEYRQAMVDDKRLVVRLKATRAYGMLPRG